MTTSTLRRTGLFLIALVAMMIAHNTNAQAQYRLGGKSVMTVYGTSTLHDWNMSARSFTTNATLTVNGNELSAINGLTLVLPVTNLKSEKESMDDNAYETLNTDKYKDIRFQLTSSQLTPAGGGKYQVTAVGNLTITGVTRQITMKANATVGSDGSVNLAGSVPLKLSDFKIDRPSFMLGTLKVGDALTLNYNVNLVK